jgi:hypothetical protein
MDKSALKKAYKEARRPMGVYSITTSEMDAQYIGVSKNLPAILNRHKAEFKFGNHRNQDLQKIWNSYGESAFKFEILDELEIDENSDLNPDEELDLLAEMWVERLGCQRI